MTELVRAIELEAAAWTVDAWGVNAVWVAPTEDGAVLRAARCLGVGADPGEVVQALMMFDTP